MIRVPPRPERAKNAQPCPLHAKLLEEIFALRLQAERIQAKIRRFPHVRPDSPEGVFLRFISRALEEGAVALEMHGKCGGSIEIESIAVPHDRFASAWRCMHRYPPAQVTDLAEYRARRAAG